MQNNIIIPIAKPLMGDLMTGTALVFPSYFGGGTLNLDVTTYGNTVWPLACDDPSTPATCLQGDPAGTTYPLGLWTVGQQYPISDPSPTRKIWVEDKNGIDKTDNVSGTTFGVLVDNVTGSPDELWVAQSSGDWEIGDIIHTPAGFDASDSWNSHFPAAGFTTSSQAMDIVIQQDWLTNIGDTDPVLINIDEIVTVVMGKTDSVKIVLRTPSQSWGIYFSKITLKLDQSVDVADKILLVDCINRAIKAAEQQPYSNPIVDWKYTHKLNMMVDKYTFEML